MKRQLIALIIFIFIKNNCIAQSFVRGKITNETGETVIGCIVTLKENKSNAASTDLDGNYNLKLNDSISQTIVISYLGYQPIEEKITPIKEGVLIKNFTLKPIAQQVKEVVIEAKASRAKDYYMEKIKLNASVSMDYISSEVMKKTGDATVTAAIARVSGVSTNGGFITVRGIGDRYVKTTINGLRVPTLDPFTNNIKLDIFPSNLIDNVLINKTATPDLPCDWAGAYISVDTKDYPDKLSISIESQVGYNIQSTLTNVLSSQRSNTDWLGYDTRLRNREHSNITEVNIKPTQYQQFVGLGLGDFYSSLGVTKYTPWNDTYYKLGLVELGLLEKGSLNDEAAFKAAKLKYNEGNYSSKSFEIINADAVKNNKSFANNWNTINRKALLNFSQTFSIGNQLNLFKKPLGFLFGFKYGSATQYDDSATANRAFVDATGAKGVSSKTKQQISRETNGWSGLINLAYKYSANNSLSLLFMPNISGVNNVRNASDDADDVFFLLTKNQFYEQRKQLIYQLKSEHYIPKIKTKIELQAGYTKGNSTAPDFKNLQYLKLKDTEEYQIAGSLGVNRFYRYLEDNLFDSKLNIEMPLNDKPGLARKLKLGAAYQQNERESKQYNYSLHYGPNANVILANNDVNAFFDLQDFGISKGETNGKPYTTINKYYVEDKLASNHTLGNSTTKAVFANVDYTLIKSVRISGGLRIEQAHIYTDVFRYDSLQLQNNDGRRFQTGDLFLINPGKLDSISFLPSINIIYKLKQTDENTMNLRANYSKTVARPSIRELTETVVFDYELRNNIFGNSDLRMVQINNYDFRAEAYFSTNDNVSVSLFYKDFKNHIEVVQAAQGYTWQNVDKSFVQGIEIEGKKTLGKHFEFRANATFVKSETNFTQNNLVITGGEKKYIPQGNVKRQMFGQSPYVLNGIITYKADSIGLFITASYNMQGPRLVIASNLPYINDSLPSIPDVYELPRHLIDIKITKNFGKHITASFTIRDVLNAAIRHSYKYKEGFSLDYNKYRYGTNYLLSVGYKF